MKEGRKFEISFICYKNIRKSKAEIKQQQHVWTMEMVVSLPGLISPDTKMKVPVPKQINWAVSERHAISGHRVRNNLWISMYMLVLVSLLWYTTCLEISGRRKSVKVGKSVLGRLDLYSESCVTIHNSAVYLLDFSP